MIVKRLLSVAFAVAILAACSAAGPTGCSTTGNETPAISATADEKALYLAELAFAGAVLSVEKAVDSGALKGERAAQASAILTQAHAALQVARNAQVVGDSVQALLKADQATDLLSQLEPLTAAP